MAVPQGFEPRLNEPESLVLPLHYGTEFLAELIILIFESNSSINRKNN